MRPLQQAISGFYSEQILATQAPRGRPSQGLACYYKPKIGKILKTEREEEYIILETNRLTIIGMYVKPLTPIEDIVTTIMTVLTKTTPAGKMIIAGNFNYRMDIDDLRSKELLQLMTEEGFTLINNRNDKKLTRA